MLGLRFPSARTVRAIGGIAGAAAVGLACAACDARGNGAASGRVDAPADASMVLRQLAAQPQDSVSFAQITPKRPLDLSRSGGRLGFVWGGPGGRSIVGSYYYPQDRDFDRSHDAEWYKQNAPSWMVYKCDRTSPAPLFTYNWGYFVPIDTTNPAVRQYIFNTYMLPQLRSGVRVIALDNVSLRNGGGRCGVFRNGQWVQLFSGEGRDPAYTAAELDWIGWLARQIHANGGLLALNARIDPKDVDNSRKLISLGDIWLNEAAFTHDCQWRASGDDWQTKMKLSQWAAARMPWVSLDKTCASPERMSEDEAQWVVGNFLLARGPQSYLGAFHDGDPPRITLRYPRWLNPPVGSPMGTAFAVPGGGMARRFTRGIVVVNPSATAALEYTLPTGSWSNLDGAPLAGSVQIAPTSAAVILAR